MGSSELPQILVKMLKSYYPDYPLTQESVSAIVQMHPRTLNRRLAEYGMSFRGIRNEVLMEKATHALSATDLSLATISVLLGYANQSAFSRAFTQLTGITPLKYRQKGLNPDTSSQSR